MTEKQIVVSIGGATTLSISPVFSASEDYNVYVSLLRELFKPQHLVYEEFLVFIKRLNSEYQFCTCLEL